MRDSKSIFQDDKRTQARLSLIALTETLDAVRRHFHPNSAGGDDGGVILACSLAQITLPR